MKLSHILVLLLVTVIWGFNFVPIHVGLEHVPPLTLTTMRFVLTIFPAIFFVKKPAVPLHNLVAYGVLLYAGQFSFLFSSMHVGLSAGLASLVLQFQAFFTIGLTALFLKERPLPMQIIGAMVSGCGILVVGLHIGGEVTMLGLMFAIFAAFSWSCGNILTKTFGKADMFAVVIWGNLFAIAPMVVIAGVIEGPDAIVNSVTAMGLPTLLSLGYIAYCSTFVGYTLWSRMLAQHPAANVAPFTLLVPVFAMISASLFLGETYPLWKFGATVLILTGLILNQFGTKIGSRMRGFLRPTTMPD